MTALILMPFTGTSCWVNPFKAAIMIIFQSMLKFKTEVATSAQGSSKSVAIVISRQASISLRKEASFRSAIECATGPRGR